MVKTSILEIQNTSKLETETLTSLMKKVRACRQCEDHLPLGPRPVLQASKDAKLLIIGQAPGIKVHQSGVPWSDASGERLREWLGLSDAEFSTKKRSPFCQWLFAIQAQDLEAIFLLGKNAFTVGTSS